MADLFDLFDEPAAPESPPPVKTAPAAPPEPTADGRDEAIRLNHAQPCRTPYAGVHRCEVGGGHAMFSADGERTWVCGLHAPPGFFAKAGERSR